jgi:hypothetical protein
MIPVNEILSGRYKIERLLGQGGMSDVFRAIDVTGGDPVAIKLVRSADPDLARRLAQEAKALARLDNPGLVRLLDAGVHEDQAFLVMELVEGPTLAARLRRGPLAPSRTAILGRTLAGALAYVHSQGIVHRDVKPANVLLGPGSRVRLADFGIARLADASSLTMTGTTLGTAGYMAPEQLEHHAVGPAADVWSLGVILLESLSGQRVFRGTATEIVVRRLAGPVPLPHDLPTPWRLLFEGMLAHDPQRRPSAAQVSGLLSAAPFAEPWQREQPETEAMIAADTAGPAAVGNGQRTLIGGIAEGSDATAISHDEHVGTLVAPNPPAPGAPTPDRGKNRRRFRTLWGAVAVVVLAAAGLSAWALSSGNTPPHAPRAPKVVATTSATTTSTSTTSTSTTTITVPTASTAAATLVHDTEAEVAAGTLSSDASQSILNDLTQALSGASSGNQDQVSSAIDSMEGTIAHEVQAGTMTPADASTLQTDVATLATALGVVASPTTTSTSTSTTPPDGPGKGHH